MGEKKCTKCLCVKPLTEFHRRSEGVNKHSSHCKSCVSERTKARYAANPELYRERWRVASKKKRQNPEYLASRKKYNSDNKQAIAKQKAVYRHLNRAKFREWAQKDRDGLADSYVRRLLATRTAIKSEDAPDSLINLYRENLKITRFIKNQECVA